MALVRATGPRQLFSLAIGSLLFGFVLVYAVRELLDYNLPVGSSSIIGIGLVDLALVAWIYAIKDRLPTLSKDEAGEVQMLRASNPLPSLVAARSAALALAASRTGALLSGFYFGIALSSLLNFQVVAVQATFWNSLIAAAFSVILAGLGLWLERICTLPKSRPE